jgi:hypothetical protein
VIGLLAKILGAQPDQCALLLRTSITTDFRSMQQPGRRRSRPLLYMLITYGIVGGFLGLIAARRGDDMGYAFLMNVVSMVNVVLAVLIDFNTAILNPQDLDIIGPRPVDSRTYLAARLLNFFFYIGVVGFSMNVLPAAIGGWTFGPAYGATFLLSGIGGAFFAASVIVAVYSILIRWLNLERAKDLFLYVHVLLTLSLIVVYQLIGRSDALTFDLRTAEAHWELVFPPAWFAALACLVSREPSDAQWALSGAAIAFTAFFLAAPIRMMSLRYAEYLGSLSFSRRSNRVEKIRARAPLWKPLLPGIQFPFFELLRIQMSRDRSLKMRALPMFIIPLFFLVFGSMEGRLQNPFVMADRLSIDRAIYTIFIPYFVLLAGVNMLFVLQTSDQHKASWIFHSAPIARPDQVAAGMVKFVLYGLAMPLMIVFAAVSAYLWGNVWQALFHGAISWLQIELAVAFASVVLIHDFPFSRPLSRGESFKFLLFHTAMIILFGAVSAVQIVSYRYAELPAYLAGILFVVAIATRWTASRVVGARLRARKDFAP